MACASEAMFAEAAGCAGSSCGGVDLDSDSSGIEQPPSAIAVSEITIGAIVAQARRHPETPHDKRGARSRRKLSDKTPQTRAAAIRTLKSVHENTGILPGCQMYRSKYLQRHRWRQMIYHLASSRASGRSRVHQESRHQVRRFESSKPTNFCEKSHRSVSAWWPVSRTDGARARKSRACPSRHQWLPRHRYDSGSLPDLEKYRSRRTSGNMNDDSVMTP